MGLIRIALIAGLACTLAGANAAMAQSGAMPVPPSASGNLAQASASDYRLGANDRVTISVYGEDELSREYIVSPAGSISMPLIGEIPVQGRTAGEVRSEVQDRLSTGYINNPTVTVMISGFRNFYILGEINRPGEYAYESGLTVLQAVAEAAGFTYRAAKRDVFIKHEGETTESRVRVAPDMLVRPGDTIRFGERYF